MKVESAVTLIRKACIVIMHYSVSVSDTRVLRDYSGTCDTWFVKEYEMYVQYTARINPGALKKKKELYKTFSVVNRLLPSSWKRKEVDRKKKKRQSSWRTQTLENQIKGNAQSFEEFDLRSTMRNETTDQNNSDIIIRISAREYIPNITVDWKSNRTEDLIIKQ